MCPNAAMERPNQRQTHPATLSRNNEKCRPGSHLTIDASGAFHSPARGNKKQAFLLTDVYSSYRVAVPTVDKTCHSLLNEIKRYISHVGYTPEYVWLKSSHTDNEFMCEPLRTWCIEKNVKLTSCAPHTHQQNAVSENTVKMVKKVVRKNEIMANTGAKLRALCYVWSAVQLNHTPSSTDPSGHFQSPCKRWPNAPFHHATQQMFPWGCLAHGFVGKRSENPNSAPRAYPGIFVGHSDDTSGYLIYHEDSDTVVTYGYINAFPEVFPCHERKMAGEHPATLVSGDWRRWSDFRLPEVPDGPLSEFLTGKQIEVVLPQDMYPAFKGSWKATCQRPITLKTGKICMRLVFSDYTGDKNTLSPADQECLTSSSDLWIDIDMSPHDNPKDNKRNATTHNLRELLANTYPGAKRMHEYASESVRTKGHYPTSSIARTPEEDLQMDTYEEFFELDEPFNVNKEKKSTQKILKKPTQMIMKAAARVAIRATLKTPIRLRKSPQRLRALYVNYPADGLPPGISETMHVIDETPQNFERD